jgi:hypothetical protein
MKTYINGILISALLLIFTFDFISQTLTYNHADFYEEGHQMFTEHDQNVTVILEFNEQDSTLNLYWDEHETHFFYVLETSKEYANATEYNVSNTDRFISVVKYTDKDIIDINIFKDDGDCIIKLYNDDH